jgi:hypothetical protein
MALEYKNNNQKSEGKSGKLCNLKSLSAQDPCKKLFVILSSGVNSSAEYPAPAEYSFASEYFIPMGCLVPMEYSVKELLVPVPCSCGVPCFCRVPCFFIVYYSRGCTVSVKYSIPV